MDEQIATFDNWLTVEALETCELCSNKVPIEDMVSGGDFAICEDCHERSMKHFYACAHEWRPVRDDFDELAHACDKCSGLVSDEDFPRVVGGQMAVAKIK